VAAGAQRVAPRRRAIRLAGRARPPRAQANEVSMAPQSKWFSVRTIVHRRSEGVFEERITLWHRVDADEAADAALRESAAYAADTDAAAVDCGLAQVYEPYGDAVGGLRAPADGCEIFSLVRRSDLAPDKYLDAFFDTGDEQQQVI
jgi:hypothetical protein